jgi:hypothetical protein
MQRDAVTEEANALAAKSRRLTVPFGGVVVEDVAMVKTVLVVTLRCNDKYSAV